VAPSNGQGSGENFDPRKMLRMLLSGGDLLWTAVAFVVIAGIALFSVTDIEPGEAAVKVNNITGSQQAITTPGWTIRIPFVQSVYILDAKQQTFQLKGNKVIDQLHVPELGVRASDGSNFRFTDTTIIFQLAADKAVEAMRDGGRENGFLRWMKPYARSILRDEFGKESTINVSDPTKYGTAGKRARRELNKHLSLHGLLVTQLVTPRPRFSHDYEKAIEDRNALANQLDVIKSNLKRAKTERERNLAEIDQKYNKVIQTRRAKLESDLAKAIAAQSQAKRAADTYRISKIADGQAALSGATQKAIELAGQLAAQYKAKAAEIAAFRTQPVERVMEKLGEKLRGVTIQIQPYANDAAPKHIKLQRIGGGK
jgi:hypothetical protein